MEGLFRNLFQRLLPDGCLVCSADRVGRLPLCARCRRELVPADSPACRLAIDGYPEISSLRAAWFVERGGAARAVIHGLKYSHLPWIGDVLGGILANIVGPVPDLITPVPLNRVKWRERGFNQAEAIAVGVASGMGGVPVQPVLVRPRGSVSQTLLDRSARSTASRDIFRVKDDTPLEGRRVLLVDDIFTTGSTASAAARCLLDAGASHVDVAVAGLTPARRATTAAGTTGSR